MFIHSLAIYPSQPSVTEGPRQAAGARAVPTGQRTRNDSPVLRNPTPKSNIPCSRRSISVGRDGSATGPVKTSRRRSSSGGEQRCTHARTQNLPKHTGGEREGEGKSRRQKEHGAILPFSSRCFLAPNSNPPPRAVSEGSAGDRGDATRAGDGRRRGELPARRGAPRLRGRAVRQVLHHLVS